METNDLLKNYLVEELIKTEGPDIKTQIENSNFKYIKQKIGQYKKDKLLSKIRILIIVTALILFILKSTFTFFNPFIWGFIAGLSGVAGIYTIIRLFTNGLSKDRQMVMLEMLTKLEQTK
jgi:hypothetical protein